jgi:hypothetical protein
MLRVACSWIGLVCALATTASAQESRSDLFSQQPGRYQIVINPQVARYTFLVDTATGRVWQLTTYTDLNDSPLTWSIMPRVDNDADISRLAMEHGVRPKEGASTTPPAKPQAPMRLNSN